MSKIKVHAWDILRMIPDEEIAKIAKDTKVDYCAKVLTGERLFYLLVFAFLSLPSYLPTMLVKEDLSQSSIILRIKLCST